MNTIEIVANDESEPCPFFVTVTYTRRRWWNSDGTRCKTLEFEPWPNHYGANEVGGIEILNDVVKGIKVERLRLA